MKSLTSMGSKVFIENGEVKTILSEEIQQSGYMSVEEAKQLTIAEITKIYQLKDGIQEEHGSID